MKVAVSFIKSKYDEKETIKKINETSADFIHVDIMDGKFVENKNYSIYDIKEFLIGNKKALDVHLMCEDVKSYIDEYASLMPSYITFHLEAVSNPLEIIDLIHSYGIKCGISIKPNTEVKDIAIYLDKIEQVLVMSVEPGRGGQEFMISSIRKIDELKSFNKDFIVSVDGGINNETILYVKNADMVVSGSYICMSNDYEKAIEVLKKDI